MNIDPNDLEMRRQRLSPEKRELLARRLQGKGAGGKAEVQIPKRTKNESAPLSYSQQGLFILEQYSPGLAIYHIPLVFELLGPVDVDILNDSLDLVIERHEILRTRFDYSKGTSHQHVDSAEAGLLQFVDLRNISAEQRKDCARELANEQARRTFDFSRGPMLRGCLYALGKDHHMFVIVVHHIVFDGWSVGILLNELAVIYNALARREPPRLEPLPIQFADFAAWQRGRASNGEFNRDMEYWRAQLRDEPPQLDFLARPSTSDASNHTGGLISLHVSPVVVGRIKEFCRGRSTTLFIVLLAVWKTLLYKYSGNNDIAVGAVVAGRTRPELESLIGYFVNMVVLRSELAGNLSFLQVVDRVQVATIGAQEHQELPFELMVQELRPNRIKDQTPFVQNMFLVQNTPQSAASIPGVEISTIDVHTGTAKFPLSLLATEDGHVLRLDLEFDTSVMDSDETQRLMERYEHLLEQVLVVPETPLDSLTLLPPQEQEKILVEWNDTRTEYPSNACVHHIFEGEAVRRPHATALTFLGSSVSYQELNERANQLAHLLQAKGVGPECLVATYLERSVSQIVALLAILKAGGAYVPLDLAAPKERLKFVLEDTGAQLLLTTSILADQLPGGHDGIIRIDETTLELDQLARCNLPDVEVHSRNLAYVMYTSGSTGVPKGVCIEHRSIVRLVRNTNYADFSQDHAFLQFAPVSFDASTFEIWGPLLNGAKLVIYPPEFASLREFGEFLQRERVTTLWLTAGLFHKIVDVHLDALSGLRQLLAGGDILSPHSVRKVLESFPHCALINGYGPTESTTFACCHTLGSDQDTDFVPIGGPISNTSVYVLDPWGTPLPVGITGELYIGGDGVARGYLNSPNETRERFIPDPFRAPEGGMMYRTGDLAQWLPEGTLKFLGRMDNQVKVRGFRVELSEIEFVLEQLPSIVSAAVLLRGDSSKMNRLVAYAVPTDGVDINLGELRRGLSESLPDYMLPSALVVIPEMPLNSNGKIDRVALSNYCVNDSIDSVTESSIEPEYMPLIAVWKKLLSVERVGLNDNFFDLGGHSLLALELVDAMQNEFCVRISLRSFLEHPTILQLAELLRDMRTEADSTGAQNNSPEVRNTLKPKAVSLGALGSKSPFFFICGAADVAEAYGCLASHMSPDQPFYGIQESLESLETGTIYSVNELADQFIECMREIQPHGPYCLGGWSFGGLVAFQMAQRLHEMNERVVCLILVDCESRPLKVPWYRRPARDKFESLVRSAHRSLRRIRQRAETLWYALPLIQVYAREILTIARTSSLSNAGAGRQDLLIREYLQWVLEDMKENCEFRRALKKGTTSHRSRLTYTQDPYVRTLHRVINHRRLVMESYLTKDYPGRIVLIRASEAPLEWLFSDKALGWDNVAREGVELDVIPGDHMSIIREPHVREFARVLQSRLDDASSL